VVKQPIQLSGFSAVTLDVYGTILDWEPEVAQFLQDWLRPQGVKASTAELLLMYDRLRQPLQARRPILPYPEVLRMTLDAMAQELGCELAEPLRQEFGGIAVTHEPYPDSREALQGLRARGLKLGALSNIDDASFSRVLKNLDVPFDVVVTAERVASYKPGLAHFETALADFAAQGTPQSRILHVAQSRRADIVPANLLGIRCVWVNRKGHVFGREGDGAETARPDLEVPDLASVLEL
jgi:2-haloalkanoic acid dehalogenase type II